MWGVDQQFVVSPVDRVVEHGRVQADFDVLRRQRAVMDERVADLGRHRVVDALLGAAAADRRRPRIAEQEAYADTGARPLAEDSEQVHVLGEEEPAVDEDADLPLRRGEEPVPHTSRGTALRCG
jgi:hypothetical protein